jgi:hypothetical protein
MIPKKAYIVILSLCIIAQLIVVIQIAEYVNAPEPPRCPKSLKELAGAHHYEDSEEVNAAWNRDWHCAEQLMK